MNKNITTLIACIVALIVGYSLYPIINDTQPKAHISNNAQKHMQPESQDFSQRSETKDSNKTEDSQEIVSAKKESSNTQRTVRANQEKTANFSSSKNNNEGSKSEYEASADEVLSLQTWTEEHKESLKQTIDYNLPKDKAQQLISYIEMNNPFLNEPEVKQDAISDEEWAYQTKQQIENFLAQHSNGSEIEVLNLTCKQLTCEMLIRAQNVGSWIKILGGLYNELDSEKYYIKSKDMKQLTYPNDEQFFFYQHFIFLNK